GVVSVKRKAEVGGGGIIRLPIDSASIGFPFIDEMIHSSRSTECFKHWIVESRCMSYDLQSFIHAFRPHIGCPGTCAGDGKVACDVNTARFPVPSKFCSCPLNQIAR